MSIVRRHLPLLSVLLALALLAAAGCGQGEGGTVRDLDEIKASGSLEIGLEPGYLPFEMKTSKGELIGFDVEMAREIARRIGVEATFREFDWDGIIPALRTGKVDCVISGMSITEDRKKVISFSSAYYEVGQAVLINRKDVERFKSHADLDQEGIVLTVQTGTTGEKAARQTFKKAEIKSFDRQIEAAMEVKDGRAQGMVFDHPFIAIYARRNAEFVHPLLDRFTEEEIGIAVRQDAPKLLVEIDRVLAELKSDGTLAGLEDKYFVTMPWLPEIGDE